ncbi:BON domain-containing protein [Geobacter sp. DSM 9736]|uniref:BON domain-containing protein n=1 Tax=Geobacter sp. DSM 9736 TaxID=1277350 RepID=UPI000B507456|nr:BON domain-containing protein [Geobacter sp. DSM 9736]SNB44665.1 Osmotically-inducible protein OsmY, contains BON domain [Geobacter sp. DSM 9736]
MAGNNNPVVKEIRAALERESRVNPHRNPINITFEGGAVILEGEVESIIAKKMALHVTAAVRGVEGIVDRLRLAQAEPMEDGAIRDHVCDSFMQDLALREYTVRTLVKEAWEVRRDVSRAGGVLEVEVTGGVVILNGRAGSISHKRLAGVLAWWVPGVRDVINSLELDPPMADNDYELADAVLLVLGKDPFVDASHIRVGCKDYVVTLDGIVKRPRERDMAEADAWYVFQVNNVVNRIQVVEGG